MFFSKSIIKEGRNGMEWNGMEWNGMDGMEWKWNEWNGMME